MALGFGNTLAELAVKISVDAQGLVTGLKDAEKQVATSSQNMIKNIGMIGGAFVGISATILGVLGKCTTEYAKNADAIQEMSQRTGLSYKAIQELGYASKLTGGSIDGLETSVKRMQVALYGAKTEGKDVSVEMKALNDELAAIGESDVSDRIAEIQREISRVDPKSKTAASRIRDLNEQIEKIKKDTTTSKRIAAIKNEMAALQDEASQVPDIFEKLNLNIGDLKKLNAEQQLMMIAEALAGVSDDGERAAYAVAVFGKSGTDLLPMLANGKQGLIDMREEVNKLGGVMGDDAVDAGAELQDKFEALKTSAEGLGNKIGEILTPDLIKVIDRMTDFVTKAGEWIDKNDELVTAIRDIAIALGVLGVAFVVAATAMAIFQAMTPGVGWATLAIGLAAAGVAVAGIHALLEPQPSFVFEHPGLASGGIVTRPTLAMVGESGPEAIVPLNQMGGDVSYHLYIDGEQITDVIEKRMANRLSAYGTKGYI